MRTTIPTGNAILTAYRIFIDGPTGNGTIEIYTGDVSPTLGAPPPGDLLGILTYGRPSHQNPSGGYMDTYSISPDVDARATGTMGCFVQKNSSGTIVGDGSITDMDGDGDLKFDDIEVEEGDTIAITNIRVQLVNC